MKKLYIEVFCFVLIFCVNINGSWLEDEDEPIDTETKSNTQIKTQVSSVSKEGFEISDLVVKKNKKSIILEWQNPDNIKDYNINIYRGDSAFDNPSKLQPEKIVKSFNKPVTSWTDNISTPGTYFYGVTIVADGIEKKTLTPEHSYNLIGVEVTEPVIPLPVTVNNISAEYTNGIIILNWTLPPNSPTNLTYGIYRDVKPILSLSNMHALAIVKNSFMDVVTSGSDKEYYYAVSTINEAGENKKIILGKNSLKDPVIIKKIEPVAKVEEKIEEKTVVTTVETESLVSKEPVKTEVSVSTEKAVVPKQEPVVTTPPVVSISINKIIPSTTLTLEKKTNIPLKKDYSYILITVRRKYFETGDYVTAEKRFRELAEDPDCPENIANEARLFLARTLYERKEYIPALKIFVKLRHIYPEETEFWINRIASKL